MPVVVGIKFVMPSVGFDAHLLQLTSTSRSLASSLGCVQLSHESYESPFGCCWYDSISEQSELVRSISR